MGLLTELAEMVSKGDINEGNCRSLLETIKGVLIVQANDRRSLVVKGACDVIARFSEGLGPSFGPFGDFIVPQIWGQTNIKIKAMAEPPHECIKVVLRTASVSKLIKTICKESIEGPSKSLRTNCGEYLVILLDPKSPSREHVDRHAEDIEAAIRALTEDAAPEARAFGRQCFWSHAALWPERSQGLLAQLPPSVAKLLPNSKPSASTVTAREAENALARVEPRMLAGPDQNGGGPSSAASAGAKDKEKDPHPGGPPRRMTAKAAIIAGNKAKLAALEAASKEASADIVIFESSKQAVTNDATDAAAPPAPSATDATTEHPGSASSSSSHNNNNNTHHHQQQQVGISTSPALTTAAPATHSAPATTAAPVTSILSGARRVSQSAPRLSHIGTNLGVPSRGAPQRVPSAVPRPTPAAAGAAAPAPATATTTATATATATSTAAAAPVAIVAAPVVQSVEEDVEPATPAVTADTMRAQMAVFAGKLSRVEGAEDGSVDWALLAEAVMELEAFARGRPAPGPGAVGTSQDEQVIAVARGVASIAKDNVAPLEGVADSLLRVFLTGTAHTSAATSAATLAAAENLILSGAIAASASLVFELFANPAAAVREAGLGLIAALFAERNSSVLQTHRPEVLRAVAAGTFDPSHLVRAKARQLFWRAAEVWRQDAIDAFGALSPRMQQIFIAEAQQLQTSCSSHAPSIPRETIAIFAQGKA